MLASAWFWQLVLSALMTARDWLWPTADLALRHVLISNSCWVWCAAISAGEGRLALLMNLLA
jgi:hypothetical protein